MTTSGLSRRLLVAGASALVVAVALPGNKAAGSSRAGKVWRLPLEPDQLATYVAITEDSGAVAWIGKVDMGQGTEIGWAQMVAEELDLALDRVSIVQGHTDVTLDMGGATGSTGIWLGGAALRNAAAEARRVLIALAAERLGLPIERLSVADGMIRDSQNPNSCISYGDLIGGRYFEERLEWNHIIGRNIEIAGKARPKSPVEYKIVGRGGMRRRDVSTKVFGRHEYIVDVRLPGMVHGRMIRPPVAGAVPVSVDEASVRPIDGVQIVWRQGFLGVVAPKEWDAIRAAQQLEVTWSEAPPPFPGNAALYDHIRRAEVAKHEGPKDRGDVDAAFAAAARVLEASYEWPFQSHASMGPACAVADVRNGMATVWSATQKPHAGRAGIAAMLNLAVEQVKIISTTGAGCYGKNDAADAAMDAAILSQAIGSPVRVQGTRQEGHGWDPKGPASVHLSRAAITREGKITAWHFDTKAFSKHDFWNDESRPEYTLAGQLMGYELHPEFVFSPVEDSYAFPAVRKTFGIIKPLLDRASPLRTAPLRDPGGPQLYFAVESFKDELALAIGMDPVEFRLKHLSDPRDLAVVRSAAERAGWEPRTGPRGRTRGGNLAGQGIAYCQRAGTRVATVADVEIDRSTGKIWARRFTVAHDCGQIINPDLLRLTIEGNVVQSTSRALVEEVLFDERNVTSVDWQSYPILDITEVPENIDILLIDHPEVRPTGAGEPASRPTAAALANAIFDATGVRLRRAPLTSTRLKQALAASEN